MALPNDLSRTADGLAQLQSSVPGYSSDKKKAARALIRSEQLLIKPAADAMAADTTAYTAAMQRAIKKPIRVLGATIQPQSTLTAHDTNYATVKVVKGDGAGGAEVICASVTTQITGGSGNWTAGASEALTLSATEDNTRIPSGGVLGFSIAKAGTGVVVPICTITVFYEEEGDDGFEVK